MEELYIIISWPDSQILMEKKGFKKNCCLINDNYFLEEHGSSSYFVNKKWFDNLKF